jgi:hypothetical protein
LLAQLATRETKRARNESKKRKTAFKICLIIQFASISVSGLSQKGQNRCTPLRTIHTLLILKWCISNTVTDRKKRIHITRKHSELNVHVLSLFWTIQLTQERCDMVPYDFLYSWSEWINIYIFIFAYRILLHFH